MGFHMVLVGLTPHYFLSAPKGMAEQSTVIYMEPTHLIQRHGGTDMMSFWLW